MEKGIFYAVGVGTGDPMDMTLRAKQILESADLVVIPVKKAGEISAAYAIAQQAADMTHAEKLEVVFPMKAHADYRSYLQSGALDDIYAALDDGKTVAMVTLGDVSVYSTATYVRQMVEKQGYETKVSAGIPSFCAGAAKTKYSLCENEESLLVMPGVTDKAAIEQALKQFDNLVIMKAGKALPWLLPMLEKCGLLDHTVMLRNVGMADEYIGTPNADEYSYFTTLLIKKGGLR